MDQNGLVETTISRETVYRGGVIDVEKWQVLLPNGKTASRDVVLHHGAAAVVAVDGQGRAAMVRQYRCPIGRVTLELPAGKLDHPDEDPLACARRELEEETGLNALRFIPLVQTITTPAFCTEKISIFLALDLSQKDSHTDEDEFLTCTFLPLDELIERVCAGEIQDSKTVTGLLLAKEWLANH